VVAVDADEAQSHGGRGDGHTERFEHLGQRKPAPHGVADVLGVRTGADALECVLLVAVGERQQQVEVEARKLRVLVKDERFVGLGVERRRAERRVDVERVVRCDGLERAEGARVDHDQPITTGREAREEGRTTHEHTATIHTRHAPAYAMDSRRLPTRERD
jgi:hypothetical protein